MAYDPQEILAAALKEQRKRSAVDFHFFINSLVIPSATGPKNFNQCMADFQRDDFDIIAPSLNAVRDGRKPPRRRFWFERTKKSSKDADLSMMVLWLIAFSSRPLLIQICAANSKQAAIIEDRAIEITHYNPWLLDYVEIVQHNIRSRSKKRHIRARIESTSSAGEAQGATPDVLILNELVHVDRFPVMEAHLNNANGVPRGVVIVSTNAGIKGTPAWTWRTDALNRQERWTVRIRTEPAPWIASEDIEDAKAKDPIGTEFARLWQGRWVSGAGDALSEDDIDQCFKHHIPMGKEPGWLYVGGLDLGVKKDHAGIAMVGLNKQERRIRVAKVKGFIPTIPNNKGIMEIDSSRVKSFLLKLKEDYGLTRCWYDQAAGGSFMAQELRRDGFDMREADFNMPSWQTQMATTLVQVVQNGILECYHDDEGRLRRDFGKFYIEHRPPNKYKLTAAADHHGHADVGFALAMVLPDAVDMLGGFSLLQPSDRITDLDDSPLTEEEWETMPDEFKEWDTYLDEQAEENRLKSIYSDME